MKKFFEKQSFWNILSESEKKLILENVYEDKMSKNSCKITESDACPGLVWIRQGKMRALVNDDQGNEITLFRMNGEELCVLSASCILRGIHFDMILSAIEDTQIYVLPPEYVESILKSNSRFHIELMNDVLERFSDVIYLLTNILGKRMNIRLAEELLDLADDDDKIRITHEELATYLNSAREVISRTLKYLEQENYIESRRGVIHLKDRNGLLKMMS